MTATQALVAAAKAQLLATLPALVSAQGMTAVTGVLAYWPAMPQPAKAPEVYIEMASARIDDTERAGATLAKYVEDRRLLVAVTYGAPDPETGQGMIEGYADLVRQAIEGDPTLGATSLRARWMDTAYSPNMSGNNTLFRIAVLTFSARRQVRYTHE